MLNREWGKDPSLMAERKEVWVRDANHEAAYKKAVEALSVNGFDRKDFVDLYSQQTIDQDTAYVEEMKRRFAHDDAKHESQLITEKSLILQGIIHQNGPRWLGDPNIHFLRTDPFDDIKNGVDEVVSIPRNSAERSHVALNVDVTFQSNFEKKVARIIEAIERDELGRIKYFQEGNFRGELKGVPMMIVGASGDKLDNMQRLWLNPRSDMSNHAFRHYMMEQLLYQTNAFRTISRRLGKSHSERAYTEAFRLLRERQRVVGQPNPELREEVSADPMLRQMRALIKV